MRQGFRRDAEVKAMYDYCVWISKAIRLHPNDDTLFSFHRKVCMLTLREIMADKTECGKNGMNLFEDRLADCAECRSSGNMACRNLAVRQSGCKWFDGSHKKEFVRDRFGDEALEFLKKYGGR